MNPARRNSSRTHRKHLTLLASAMQNNNHAGLATDETPTALGDGRCGQFVDPHRREDCAAK
jgi:hypothetical protein